MKCAHPRYPMMSISGWWPDTTCVAVSVKSIDTGIAMRQPLREARCIADVAKRLATIRDTLRQMYVLVRSSYQPHLLFD